ncbi:MAG: fibronectin type III domain-containing protein [Nocardioidaceae bacterium]|jgi:endonuclease/exonuclease/phosphatase family metal-dependent hydrolase|nr:fibronectin type III domain-containing protein [Nocardioidaceae bacterium]
MLKRIIAGTACALGAVLTVVTPTDAATATPRNVRAAAVTPTTLTVRWDAVAGASAYRVQVSTSPTMSGATYHRFAGTSGVLTSLTPQKRYYFRVSVLDATGTRVSAYTPKPYPTAVTTAVPVPRNLAVVGVTPSSVALRWTPSEGASLYRVSRAPSPDFAGAVWSRTSQASLRVSGLRSATRYYFKVRVIRANGTVVTRYTTPVTGKTSLAPAASSGPVNVRVGSFNVMTVTGDQTAGNRLPWRRRRATVVNQILGERVDVIGVQEVNQSYSHPERLVDGGTQFLDLRNGLNKAGGRYALTNEYSYNCVNPRSSYKCVYRYRGASGGDRIYYNTSTLDLLSQGAYQYRAHSTMKHSFAYAVLRVKATGRKFFFANTHLDPPNRYVRMAQWKELIAKVNQLKGSLPVVTVGDFNTQKFDVGVPKLCGMVPAMKANGYGDVLNQTCATNPVVHPRARRSINGWINSLNRYHRDISTYSYENNHAKTGNNIDWIFATNSLPVRVWKMVIDYDPTTLKVQGTIPSDHNMVRATITLP